MRDKDFSSIVSPELTYHDKHQLFEGKKDSYTFYLKKDSVGTYRFHFCVSRDEKKPDKDMIAKIIRSSAYLDGFQVNGYEVVYRLRNQKNPEEFRQAIFASVEEVIAAFQKKNLQNCEEEKGKVGETFLCVIADKVAFLQEENYRMKEIRNRGERERFMASDNRPEKGLLGAFLGSLLGAVLLVILGQLGVFVVMQGLIMGILTIYGYRLTSKRRSRMTNFIVLAMMWLIMMIAHHIRSAIFFSQMQPNYSWLEAAMQANLYRQESYWAQLFLLLIFSSFVYFALQKEYKKQQQQFIFERIEK